MITTEEVWVTGSRGLIGSLLVTKLEENGHRVARVTGAATEDDGVVTRLDYSDAMNVRSALNRSGPPAVIFHLGWGAMHDPESAVHLDENLPNAKILIDEAFRAGVPKFVMVGSVDEYGSRVGTLEEDAPPVGRLTKYAQAKIAACDYGMTAASRFGKTFLHVRLTHTLGVAKRKSSLIHQLYRSYCDGSPLSLSACDQFRDYIYVADAAEGLIRIAKIPSSEVLNLGSGKKIRLRSLVEKFWNRLEGDPALLKFGAHARPANEPDQPPCEMSLEKLRFLTNWAPGIDIDEGVALTIAELKAKG